MYRYSQRMRGHGGAGGLRQRVGNVLVVLLLAAVVVLAILAGNGMRFMTREQTLFRDKMRIEAAQTMTLVNNLSRTGGSGTGNLLGKLRQHVYAMETLQQLHVALRGRDHQAVETSLFESIYAMIDTFDARLQTGQQTKEPQTQLLTMLTELQGKAASIP